ncbi:MAG: VTT domain-containing protein [Clostridiales bacterium]|nr:VTT domain-containing protein [Clostridiales bacterium]
MIKYKKLLRNISIACFVSALILVLIMFAVNRVQFISEWYQGVKTYLLNFEYKIASIQNLGWFVVAVLVLFSLKGAVPIIFFPVSACCFISGIILPVFSSFVLNLSGVALMMIVGYWRGRFMGGGKMYKGIQRHEKLFEFINKNALDNPIILWVLRMVPGVPLTMVSRIYGTLNFNFWEYILFSLGGFAPRIILYSILGSNIFDPFSLAFIIPVSLLLILTGIALAIFDIIIIRNAQKEENNNIAEF